MAINFPATPADGDTHEGYIWVAAENAWRRLPEAPAMDIENLNNVSVTSPADGESLVYDSTAGEWVNADATVDVYDVDTLSTGYFMMPVGTEEQRPASSSNGYFRFNSDTGRPEWYSEDFSNWYNFYEYPSISFNVEYLVVAGGGGGASIFTGAINVGEGGGGAGGYRCSVQGESSGSGSLAESPVTVTSGLSYSVEVGSGGAGGPSGVSGGVVGSDGGQSVFYNISSTGGGGGGPYGINGRPGGSGGAGGRNNASGGSGTSNQGKTGGSGSPDVGGGGGGALGPGSNASGGTAGNGGSGISSSINNVPTLRAGGGGGGSGATPGSGGPGGGGDGGGPNTDAGSSGATNTGGGGGGAGADNGTSAGGSGGSGVVIIKYPSAQSISPSLGLSYTTTDLGLYKVTEFTAGTGTVTFS